MKQEKGHELLLSLLTTSIVAVAALPTLSFSSSSSSSFFIQSSYAQFGSPQQLQEGEEVQEESDGDLTATLNGDSFTRGDTITVRGTVGERDIDSFVVIEIIDPESERVEYAFPDVTADNTWTQSFRPGGEETNIYSQPWTESGNYRMTVRYSVPGEDFEREELEFVFSYDAESQRTTTMPGGTTGATTTTAPPSTVFQSNVDGIRAGVPEGWIAEDVDNEAYQQRLNERNGYANKLVEVCPQDQTLPQIGGGNICPDGVQDGVSVYRFGYLQSQPAFAGVVAANINITVSDLLAYFIQFMEERVGYSNFGVVQNVDRDVNIVDSQTNEVVSTTTGKFVEVTMQDDSGISGTDFAFLVMGTDGNTGYVLLPLIPGIVEELPPEQQHIFDSFELLAPNNTGTQSSPDSRTSPPQLVEQHPSSSSPSTPQLQSPQQEGGQPQQQLQEEQQSQGGDTGISIVPGSSSLTADAYQPNPIQVSVGTTVTWTNDDSQPHTATSGENLTPDGRFDSGILAPAATFDFTFTEAGEYPYFCLLHPNMVGTISVS